MSGLVFLPLPLEELEVARRALECRETAGPGAPTLNAPPAIQRGDRGGRTDEPSQEKGA
ncbi:MAG TPA: hypothetical protein VFN06_02015 [Gaiellaceae bacterium]|nr:hypothetical protein [Gaiellaceae bacterium]